MPSPAVGFVCVAAAVLLFGLFSLPTKSHKTGDGLFFQLAMCVGIFFVGGSAHVVECAAAGPCAPFSPLAALGGAIWALSNLLLIPVVNAVGVGRAMLTWGSAEMLTGWATARFGLFGLRPEVPQSVPLNDAGVALGVLSILVLAAASSGDAGAQGYAALGASAHDYAAFGSVYAAIGDGAPDILASDSPKSIGAVPARAAAAAADAPPGWPDWETNGYDVTATLRPAAKRAFGVVAALVAGALSGSMFTPAQYVCDHAEAFPRASRRLSEHLFSHNTGVLLASVAFFGVYAAATRNRPWASAELALPALASGVCWGLATLSWFAANEALSIPIAFPLVTLGPGLVSLLIGGVFYGEVVGARAAGLLALSCALFAGAAVCIGLSGGGG
jgi:hypothetical protein